MNFDPVFLYLLFNITLVKIQIMISFYFYSNIKFKFKKILSNKKLFFLITFLGNKGIISKIYGIRYQVYFSKFINKFK